MAIVNPGFEDAGATPGEALGWTWLTVCSAERMAAFGSSVPEEDAERFESEWSNDGYLFAFDPFVDIVAPIFDSSIGTGETYEDFEEAWSTNHGYSFEMGSTEAASFDALLTPEAVEDYAEGWSSNESYSFTMGSTTAALFDAAPEAFEDFEEGWFTGTYDTAMGATTAALFDGGGEAYEDFEETYGPIYPSAIDYGTSTITHVAHGLGNGNIVRVRPIDGAGLLPQPLRVDSNYYIVGSTANTFQLSGTSGGAAIVMVATGTGIAVYRNPTFYWEVNGPT